MDDSELLDPDTIDDLAFGVILIDREGIVRGYNLAEVSLARRSKATTIGKHFFREVAPCTRVKEFESSFEAFLDAGPVSGPRFNFTFLFAWAPTDVVVHFVRIPTFDGAAVIIEEAEKLKALGG